jgi:D-amino peptidase
MMNVYVLTDIEGVSGIMDFDRQCWPHSPDFQQARELLTGEVNAAVEGAVEAGADSILICDAHYQGQNILIDRLHFAAELIQGKMRPHWLPCIDEGFDVLIQLGAHARAGTPEAILCHSMELDIVQISLNGRTIGEIGMAAAAAGAFGMPTVLVTGDQAAVSEMKTLVPQSKGAIVKQALSYGLGRHLSPQAAHQLIKQQTIKALQRYREIPPFQIETPYCLQITYNKPVSEYLKKKTNLAATALSPTTIEYRDDNILRLFSLFE